MQKASVLQSGIWNSPIKGPEGNIEYLAHLKNQEEGTVREQEAKDPAAVVEQAHQALQGYI